MPKKIEVDFKKLPQIRVDPLTGRSAIISVQRRLRMRKEASVVAYPQGLPAFLETCPFCPGSEEETPEELVRMPFQGKWQARGFANLFPFLMIEDGDERNDIYPFFERYFVKGIGAHEIVVESPRHNACLSSTPEDEIVSAFWAMAERYLSLKGDKRFNYFYGFKNYGPDASQDHPHWQLEARGFAPPLIKEKCQRMMAQVSCLLCRLWQEEVKTGRMIAQTDRFVAYVPFAPSEPYEVKIVPKDHAPNFASDVQSRDTALELVWVLKQAVNKVKKALQIDLLGEEGCQQASDPPYIMRLYTAPYDCDGPNDYYHWHIDFLPLTTNKVGHEWGTGEDVIPAFPEEIAEILRNI